MISVASVGRASNSLCPDGYIRTSLTVLASRDFKHVMSARDEDVLTELLECCVPVSLAGWTEWVSTTEPVVSLSWDWCVEPNSQRLLRIEDVRSNLMLVDRRGYDVGMSRTARIVGMWLAVFDWQAIVREAVLQANGPPNTYYSQ